MANIELNDVDTEENNVIEAQSELEVEAKDDGPSIRDALKAQLDREVEKPAEQPATTDIPAPQQVAQPQQDKPLLAPPADMRKEEKEAFLNPTPENAHVLQAYMNRRAYETRSDYQRKMAEVEQLKQQTSGLYDVLKQHETDYAKHGISIGDVARRSIAWDKAMQSNPIETALEWLDAYGISPQDLMGAGGSYDPQSQQQMPQQPNYLTKEEAERIAEEKFNAIKQQEQKNAVAYYNERIVESFLNSKPLFKDPETASQLEAEMAPIVSGLAATGRYSSPEEILETAYRYVVAGNPTFSSLTQAVAAKAVVEQKQAEVAKAKNASRSISGSAGSGTPRVQTKNLRDNLRRRFVDG